MQHPPRLTPKALALGVAILTALGLPAGGAAQDADGNVAFTAGTIPWGQPGQTTMAPLYGNPGAEGESFTFRLEVDDGFEMGPHTHPVAEHMTVLSGRFYVGFGETLDRSAAVEYGPGSYIVVGAGVPAYMWAEGKTVVQVHGVGPLSTEFIEPPGR